MTKRHSVHYSPDSDHVASQASVIQPQRIQRQTEAGPHRARSRSRCVAAIMLHLVNCIIVATPWCSTSACFGDAKNVFATVCATAHALRGGQALKAESHLAVRVQRIYSHTQRSNQCFQCVLCTFCVLHRVAFCDMQKNQNRFDFSAYHAVYQHILCYSVGDL